ncbi:hypothetical protein METHP15_100049 [Pseudomonas sp. P15-2025]
MRYVYKSTKFQPRENRALTPNNRLSVSAPDNLADGDFCYRGGIKSGSVTPLPGRQS